MLCKFLCLKAGPALRDQNLTQHSSKAHSTTRQSSAFLGVNIPPHPTPHPTDITELQVNLQFGRWAPAVPVSCQ
jgi:hypothetical protein